MTAELISVQNREGHSPVRTWRYECGHEYQGILLTPPKECTACRQARYTRETEEAALGRVAVLNARRAVEEANRAHDYGKRHLICERCFLSRQVDAYALTEAHADMFAPKPVRGFQK